MTEKEIIEEFVNSENFAILHNYCIKPCEETIEELDKEIHQLKEQLKQRDEVIDEAIDHLDAFISDTNLSKYDVLKVLMHTKKIIKKAKGDNK